MVNTITIKGVVGLLHYYDINTSDNSGMRINVTVDAESPIVTEFSRHSYTFEKVEVYVRFDNGKAIGYSAYIGEIKHTPPMVIVTLIPTAEIKEYCKRR